MTSSVFTRRLRRNRRASSTVKSVTTPTELDPDSPFKMTAKTPVEQDRHVKCTNSVSPSFPRAATDAEPYCVSHTGQNGTSFAAPVEPAEWDRFILSSL